MKLFKKAAIVGTGLIGGSVALALKKRRLVGEVVGVSKHKETLLWAKRNKIIDRGSQNLDIIKDADLVVLAAAAGVIVELAPAIARIIPKVCVVTDVASTKGEIVNRLEQLFPLFVGSHPLAGSEKRGIKYCRQDMFEGALCVITPTKNTSTRALVKIKNLWRKLGSEVALLSPQKHDEVLSLVSHLPHVLAFSLMNTVPGQYLKFSAGSLKDTTRIASSEPNLWLDILLSNQKYILLSMDAFQKNLSEIKTAIIRGDRQLLSSILQAAKSKREKLA